MSEEWAKRQRWWSYYRFPLVPEFRVRAPDRHNTRSFYFHWLAFRAWTSDAPMLGIEVELTDANLQFRLNLPYLWTGLFIPIFPERWHQKLWRKPKYERSSDE